MNSFPHFHWMAIQGTRPNVPENYVKGAVGLDNQDNINKISKISSAEQENITDKFEDGKERPYMVANPVIHNISKELQIFQQNFEDRFRKEVKVSKLESSPLEVVTEEFKKTLLVIEREPGVVEILPYLMEFLGNASVFS